MGKAIALILAMFATIALSAIGITYCATATNVATAPGRVANKVLGTDNIIYNYEWFYDVQAQYDARTNQLVAWNKEYVNEQDQDERRRLRVEVQAVSQSCRNLVTSYNANAQKLTRKVFKGWSLPDSLDMNNCEVSS